MVPTTDLEDQLRILIDEVIPVGGTDADTRFTTAEIDSLLSLAGSIYEAAALAWVSKAAKVAGAAAAGIVAVSVGAERYQFATAKDFGDFAFRMAEYYRGLVPGFGTVIFGIDWPVVAQTIVRDDNLTEQQYIDALAAAGIPLAQLQAGFPIVGA
jgi:hypothetical protein